MKNNLLPFFAPFLFASFLSAQPILQNDVFPKPGDKVTYASADTVGIFPGDPGSDRTWEFANLQIISAMSPIAYMDASDTPFWTDFPDASVAGATTTNSQDLYAYFVVAPDQILAAGTGGVGYKLEYTDKELLLQVPLYFNDGFSDIFARFDNVVDNSLNETGSKNVTYDAYGTLKLPSGVYPNAIRLKTIETLIDSISEFAGIRVNHFNITQYDWYVPGRTGSQITVAVTKGSVDWFSYNPASPSIHYAVPPHKSVQFASSLTTGISVVPSAKPDWSVSMVGANPVITDVQMNVDLATDAHTLSLTIFDEMGRPVQAQMLHLVRGDNPIDIEVGQLPPGNYVLALTDGHTSHSVKWQKI